jgi:hypothetical protein
MAIDHFHLPGVEWDEIEPGITVFVPEALAAPYEGSGRASFVQFLRKLASLEALDLVDLHALDTYMRWSTKYLEDGAFFYDDQDRLVIPVRPSTIDRVCAETESGIDEIELGDVRVQFVRRG